MIPEASNLFAFRRSGAPVERRVSLRRNMRTAVISGLIVVVVVIVGWTLVSMLFSTSHASDNDKYPWHTGIVATTFWVGEIFDPNAEDGSQMFSTYDSDWFDNYGGCDGVEVDGVCTTEKRVAANGFFPSSMTPKQNPFYLDLPYDDVHDALAFRNRASDIPWANDPGYAGRADDRSISFMKNRWVKLVKGAQTCYGQIADAGPGEYHDAAYVFGVDDTRPFNSRYGGAGMDVSPALNGCLGFTDLDGDDDVLDWQFVDVGDVPEGPWSRVQSSDNSVVP